MPTTVPNRMLSSAPISVKDFGAKGDGVTNDTAAIQVLPAAGEASYLDFRNVTITTLGGSGELGGS